MPVSDIRVQRSLRNNPKFHRLERLVGDGAAKYLLWLWLAASESRMDGRLTGWDATDIAIACDWHGKPEDIVESLTKTRWLDRDGDCWVIHDWGDHQPWAVGFPARSEQAKVAGLASAAARARKSAATKGKGSKEKAGHKPSQDGPVRNDPPAAGDSPIVPMESHAPLHQRNSSENHEGEPHEPKKSTSGETDPPPPGTEAPHEESHAPLHGVDISGHPGNGDPKLAELADGNYGLLTPPIMSTDSGQPVSVKTNGLATGRSIPLNGPLDSVERLATDRSTPSPFLTSPTSMYKDRRSTRNAYTLGTLGVVEKSLHTTSPQPADFSSKVGPGFGTREEQATWRQRWERIFLPIAGIYPKKSNLYDEGAAYFYHMLGTGVITDQQVEDYLVPLIKTKMDEPDWQKAGGQFVPQLAAFLEKLVGSGKQAVDWRVVFKRIDDKHLSPRMRQRRRAEHNPWGVPE